MYGNEGYKFLTCPYDPSHIIRSYRLPYHIRKCKKNHPDVKLENCVYNFSHLIKAENFLDHLETCPNKCRIEADCYHDSSLEHETCTNEICDDPETESDAIEENFRLVKPLQIRSRVEEELEYLALQEKKLDCGVSNIKSTDSASHSENHVNSKLLLLDEDLPPLQLPKTTSKAFQIKK